jgi:hypothetical protein
VAKAVMSRLLHEPTIRLRSLSEARGHASLELVRELFGLREDTPSAAAAREARAGNIESADADDGYLAAEADVPDNVRPFSRRTRAGGA